MCMIYMAFVFVFKAVHVHTILFCVCVFHMLTCCVLFAFHNLLCLKCVWYIVCWELFFLSSIFTAIQYKQSSCKVQKTGEAYTKRSSCELRFVCWRCVCSVDLFVEGQRFDGFPKMQLRYTSATLIDMQRRASIVACAFRIYLGESNWHAYACLCISGEASIGRSLDWAKPLKLQFKKLPSGRSL